MPRLLLINPWITDFAAYDLWLKPLGLLYVGAYLRAAGYDIDLIDCMDRNHPSVKALMKPRDTKPDGRGKFYKTQLPKPAILQHIPRHWGRYGIPEEAFLTELARREKPDAVLVTSVMTYWYPGVQMVIRHVKAHWPGIPIILGGTYATLCTEHARKTSGADAVIAGYGEKAVFELLKNRFHLSPADKKNLPDFLNGEFPLPWDLYPKLDYAVILSARGCPYTCSFCATHLLNPCFIQRPYREVFSEIRDLHQIRGLRHFAFYDDALFINKQKHIEPLLELIIESKLPIQFHCPNGLFAKMIDEKLARLMVQAGFATIRLSLESANEAQRKRMSYKVSNAGFIAALENLEKAGFPRHRVETYVIMGLPDQSPEEVQETIDFVHECGARVSLASFSPIPGTADWDAAVDHHGLDPNIDPLLLNNTIYPLKNERFSEEIFSELRHYAKQGNERISCSTESTF
ncbi:MAG: B12-binding domain-containing radical SAM protein [Lentisphaeria bacterium]|nr:B12-binding domain-containing radical SAM protein [Candidatus Neomarinimicrobiota bacterium]MCF7843186.1 B12-binding domain-containing radical SAM protein [Lentisphaeria bacterium]